MKISFILPCYEKAALFAAAWPLNYALREPDTETVIVLDDPYDERYFTRFVQNEHRARIRLIVNSESHSNWRPPAKAINVGVRHAEGQFVAILSPESILETPMDGYLAHRCRTGQMLMGLLWNVGSHNPTMSPFDLWHQIQHVEVTNSPACFGFGFACFERCAFEAICGMDEGQTTYSRDDDALRLRLIRYGLTGIVDPMLKAFHLWHDGTDRTMQSADTMNPNVVLRHQRDWGLDDSFKVVYDWKA